MKKRRELHDQCLGRQAFLTALTRRETKRNESFWPCYNRRPLSATDLFLAFISPRGPLDGPRIRRANCDPCHQHEHECVNVLNRDEVGDGRSPVLHEKQKTDDSDDAGNDLPDVGIQAPYVA